MQIKEPVILVPYFKKFIVATKSGKRLTSEKAKLTKGTIKQYECVLKLIKEYELLSNEHLSFSSLSKQTLISLKKERKYWSAFHRNFSKFLYQEKGYFDQYVSSVFKILRTFLNYLVNERYCTLISHKHLFKVYAPNYIPIVLEPYQLQFLIQNKLFENSLPNHLQRTKDIFVFGCTVGLRYTDLMNQKKSQIIDTSFGKLLIVHTKKTGTAVKIPIPSFLFPILEKYKYKAGVRLLPKLSNVNFNIQIKQIIEKAGWTYVLPKIRHKQGKAVEIKSKSKQSLRFCDQVTTHTMRRTAITTLLMFGVPEQVVRRISGHSPGSKEFYKYISLAEDYVQKHVRKAHQQLFETGFDPLKIQS